jgi:hypothetical protein
MSISGLYDSEIGDRLARASLAPFRKIDDAEYDDEGQRKRTYVRKMCACGNDVARPFIVRKGVCVCLRCAVATPRQPRSRITLNKCEACKTVQPRSRLVMRKGKLYCKTCAVSF